jgi:hypothetical protein
MGLIVARDPDRQRKPPVMTRLAHALVAGLAILLLAVSASAQGLEPLVAYSAGEMAFHYEQTPFPIYSGDFAAAGEALPPDGQLPPGQLEAVGGATVAGNADSTQTAFYAVTDNGDGTFDLALGALATLGEPTPGVYPVDIQTGTAVFGFVDDVVAFDLPDTLDQEHLIDWILNVQAAHKLISISGSITVAGADQDTLFGTFSGTTVDIDNPLFLVNVEDGAFALSGADIVASVPPRALAVPVRGVPNPFNPRTEVRFELPSAQTVDVRVFDAAGRLVRRLHTGSLAAGAQRLAWDGRRDDGERAAAGLYLVQVRGQAWRSAAKLTLVP